MTAQKTTPDAKQGNLTPGVNGRYIGRSLNMRFNIAQIRAATQPKRRIEPKHCAGIRGAHSKQNVLPWQPVERCRDKGGAPDPVKSLVLLGKPYARAGWRRGQ